MRGVTPGEPLLARMQLQPLDAVVPPGHQLGLPVFQGGHGDHFAGVPDDPTTLHVGGLLRTLTVDAFTRDESVFFDVPAWTDLDA